MQDKIPIKEIKKIKEGAGFTNSEGEFIEHNQLTTPAPAPRSYAFCTDTLPCPAAAEFISGVDLLYHEATFQNDLEDWAAKTMHSTAKQAAELATAAKAGKLILGHFSNRYKSEVPFLTEAQEIFPHTELTEDGNKYVIGQKKPGHRIKK